ncbi:MAG: exosortase/archaeosortase family protein [Bacteroidales bacterium]|nr:exosortase/archaeosortase family protein [Bacteroidales bacterium]
MKATPSEYVLRSRSWQLCLALTVCATLFAFAPALRQLFTLWTSKADYSHGLLLLPFAGYVLWLRRDLFPTMIRWPDLWGVPVMALAGGVYLGAGQTNIAKEWLQGFAVILAMTGIVVLFLGKSGGLKWAWPALVLFPLVLELPWRVSEMLSLKLRELATHVGSATFLTAGLPAYTEGNVIIIGSTRLGVENACSGLSMLLTFVAVAAAVAILARSRPIVDRLLVLFSAIPVAVLCNLIRIVLTGLVYHAGWQELGDLIVHDLFGWLMMPLALAFIWAELRIMDWLFVPVATVSQTDILKAMRPGRVM